MNGLYYWVLLYYVCTLRIITRKVYGGTRFMCYVGTNNNSINIASVSPTHDVNRYIDMNMAVVEVNLNCDLD